MKHLLKIACFILVAWLFCNSAALTQTDSTKFLTLPPDTILSHNANGKFLKPVKRHRGLYPNWANLMHETVRQGGFQPGATETDSAGGMRIGISFMERRNPGNPAKPNWKPIKDSAKVHCWIRIGKWNFKKSVGADPDAYPKTLRSMGSIFHTGRPRGLDSTGSPGDAGRKPLHKEQKKLEPKKTSNVLFAELLALKFNIAASQLGKTPNGFGELVFDTDGNICDELSIVEISARADSMMTYWQTRDTLYYDSLYSAIYRINRAFAGVLDTITFLGGDGTLTVMGQVRLDSVGFLHLGLTPARTLTPTTYDVESEDQEDFEDDEWDEMEESGIPITAKLYQNYPNPFNPTTTVSFRLLAPSLVTLKVYNMLGQEVTTLLSGEQLDEGYQTVEFNPAGMSSGVYFYQINVQDQEGELAKMSETRKMLLIK